MRQLRAVWGRGLGCGGQFQRERFGGAAVLLLAPRCVQSARSDGADGLEEDLGASILAIWMGATWAMGAGVAEIDRPLVAVCPDRLGRLHPDDPDAYRDYAEELVARRHDPEARQTGLRLYLIAAWLEPERLGRTCLLGMLALARDSAEERRFRAMAYLLDPHGDRSVLKHAPAAGSPDRSSDNAGRRSAGLARTNSDDAGRQGLLRAIQAMRRCQHRVALQIADRPSVQEALAPFAHLLCLDQFRGIRGEVPPKMLRKLLMIEWELTRGGDPTAGDEDPHTCWSQLAHQRDTVRPLALETLTEFNPRECVYRDGRWVQPEHCDTMTQQKTGELRGGQQRTKN